MSKYSKTVILGFLRGFPPFKRGFIEDFPKNPLTTSRQTPVIPLKNAVEQGKIQRGGGKAGGGGMTNLKKFATLWRTLKSSMGFSKSLLGFSYPPLDLRGFGERW